MRRHGSDVRGSTQVAQSSIQTGRFGRMFRRLPACPAYDIGLLTGLAESMREVSPTPSGWLPAQPPLVDDNPTIPAGYTYFGQFVDHDITFDPASSLQQQNDPDALVNFRSPRFDLDSVYGSGPDDEPFQYARDELHLLITPNQAEFEDLPRNADGIAIIGDPRNDENVIVSQIQLAFLRLHNRFVDQVLSEGQLTRRHEQFAEAQRRTRWHYQFVVVNDFLPRLIGREVFGQLYRQKKNGPPDIALRHYKARTSAYMPVEFSAAAYRFGHSQIRDRYALNESVEQPLFVPGDNGGLIDLRGGQHIPPSWAIRWPFFFRLGAEEPQASRLINTRLAPSLFDLPGRNQDEIQSLALLNLLRGQTLGLPSGQDVARHVGAPVLTSEQLHGPEGAPVPEPTPLWYYLLREADVLAAGGTTLGPTGGRIVGEVLLGLLEQDPLSYYNVAPEWQPDAGIPRTGDGGQVTVGDLLSFASGGT